MIACQGVTKECVYLSLHPGKQRREAREVRLVGYKLVQYPNWATRGSIERVTARPDIRLGQQCPYNRSDKWFRWSSFYATSLTLFR